MRQAIIKYNHVKAGILTEDDLGNYEFKYDDDYVLAYPNQFITFKMPVTNIAYKSNRLFPFFDGLIPEGWLLNIASESWRIPKNDRMGLLLACCKNAIGAVSVEPLISSTND